ncbi:MAG: carbohydrate ABC transporter permease, partial [Clostridia bacterium]|nr:carbohydrate ABC transporter permease [Clostridia bacterium]
MDKELLQKKNQAGKKKRDKQSDIPVALQHRLKWTDILAQVGLVVWALICLFPVYWMFTFSLKTNNEIFGENVMGLPREWVWSNYSRALNVGNMGQYFLNSIIVTIVTIAITLVAAVMATYAITRLHWKGRKRMNKFFMLGLTIPIHAAIVPLYTTFSRIG